MEKDRFLAKVSQAHTALSEAKTLQEIKQVLDASTFAELYARRAKLSEDHVLLAIEIKSLAIRQLGTMLKETDRAKGGQPYHKKSTGAKKEPVEPTISELGISKKLASQAQRISEISEELFNEVRRGDKTVTAALREVKHKELLKEAKQLPQHKYRVIYADPPWKYGDSRGGLDDYEKSAAEAQYPTMSVEQLKILDIPKLAAENSVLFCWATFPLLPDALEVVKAWGFKYKTSFVWWKKRSNLGNYHNASAELVLVATKGSCLPETKKREEQVFEYVRTKHSKKPEEFRQLIDRIYPTGNRIELFRRGNAPDGWEIWGNEAK